MNSKTITNKIKLLVFTSCLAITLLTVNASSHAKTNETKETYLTRGEMAVMLSATDYMKEKVDQLLNFAVGYSLPTFNRATLAPVIRRIKVIPGNILLDKSTLFKVMASVDNPDGPSQIEDVKLDATSLGKPLGLKMVDNGLWGDEAANDGVFTLQDTANPGVNSGEKEITVSAVNRKGWMSVARAEIVAGKRSTSYVESYANPQRLKNGEITRITLISKLQNYPYDSSLANAYADLSSFGYGKKVQMKREGKTFYLETELDVKTGEGKKEIPVTVFGPSGNFILSKASIEVIK